MKPAHRRRFGLSLGAVAGAATIGWLASAGHAELAPGPMNTMHDDLACEACHREAPGTLRQQLQAAARNALGLATTDVDIGYRRVTSEDCRACHDRPDDRHPVGRFLEPRFAAARDALAPEHCSSCHREHSGMRVTADPTLCRHCHADTTIEHDPLDVSHRQLVATQQWSTCLGCHDYHGNHAAKPERRMVYARSLADIRRYFEGGRSPYGAPIHRATPEPAR